MRKAIEMTRANLNAFNRTKYMCRSERESSTFFRMLLAVLARFVTLGFYILYYHISYFNLKKKEIICPVCVIDYNKNEDRVAFSWVLK